MHAFIVELENRPGTVADLSEALGERGINITGVAGAALGDSAAIGLITNDDEGTRAVLEGRGSTYRELDLVAAGLEDRPGTLGKATRRLADAGVDIQAILPTGMQGNRVTVAFAVEDAAKASQALGELTAVGSAAM